MSVGAVRAIEGEFDRAAEALRADAGAWPFGKAQALLSNASTSNRGHGRDHQVLICPQIEMGTVRASLDILKGCLVFTYLPVDMTSIAGGVWGFGFTVNGSPALSKGAAVTGSSVSNECSSLFYANATRSLNLVHVIGNPAIDSTGGVAAQAGTVYGPAGIVSPQTEAARLIEGGMSLANLTQEQFAPLLGVTRRSLFNWKAGEAISARKEVRLRGLVDALTALSKFSSGNAEVTRTRLYSRLSGGLRPYDLLVEGRFDVAVQLVTSQPAPGITPLARPKLPPPPAPMLTRLSLVEDGAVKPQGRADLRRSGRFKR